MILTIDGPTASGKSTLAALLAHRLSISYLNSGFLYRALAYILVHDYGYTDATIKEPDVKDIRAILDPHVLDYRYGYSEGVQVLYKQEPLTPLLKSADVDRWASLVSSNLTARAIMHDFQHAWADRKSFIAEGRDCGTVVFPHADYKFFLTADLDVRARRWQHDQELRGKFFTLQESRQALIERDSRDTQRVYSPLRIPPGSYYIDDSKLNIEETAQLILSYIKQPQSL